MCFDILNLWNFDFVGMWWFVLEIFRTIEMSKLRDFFHLTLCGFLILELLKIWCCETLGAWAFSKFQKYNFSKFKLARGSNGKGVVDRNFRILKFRFVWNFSGMLCPVPSFWKFRGTFFVFARGRCPGTRPEKRNRPLWTTSFYIQLLQRWFLFLGLGFKNESPGFLGGGGGGLGRLSSGTKPCIYTHGEAHTREARVVDVPLCFLLRLLHESSVC